MEFAYDWFLDDNPEVLERVEKGEKRGEKRGEIQALQQSILMLVQKRFPLLAAQARPKIEQIQQVEELKQLLLQVPFVANEAEARQLLSLQASQEQG